MSNYTNIPYWKCLMCKYKSPRRFTERQLNNHLRTHTGERPFECYLCEKNYKTQAQLTVHFKMTHTGKPKLKCLFCDHGFFYEGHLRRHIQYHTKERPYFCRDRDCRQEFSRKPALLRHQLNHYEITEDQRPYQYRYQGGVKPFTCKLCGEDFSEYRLVKHECPGSGSWSSTLGGPQAQPQIQLSSHSTYSETKTLTNMEILALACQFEEQRQRLQLENPGHLPYNNGAATATR